MEMREIGAGDSLVVPGLNVPACELPCWGGKTKLMSLRSYFRSTDA